MALGKLVRYDEIHNWGISLAAGASVTLFDINGAGKIIYITVYSDGGDYPSGWGLETTLTIDDFVYTDTLDRISIAFSGTNPGPENAYFKLLDWTNQTLVTYFGQSMEFYTKLKLAIKNTSTAYSSSLAWRIYFARHEKLLIS